MIPGTIRCLASPVGRIAPNGAEFRYIRTLLGNSFDSQAVQQLGKIVNLDGSSVGGLFFGLGPSLPIFRIESEATTLQAFLGTIYFCSAHPSRLQLLLGFLDVFDWQQTHHRRAQTASECLDLLCGKTLTYERLGIAPPENTIVETTWSGSGDPRVGDPPLFDDSLNEGVFRLQIIPGFFTTRGGIDIKIVHNKDGKLAEIGLLLGLDQCVIANLQGGPAFRKHRKQFQHEFNQHPFDWLVAHAMQFAEYARYEQITGYGWRLNPWLVKHLEQGDFPSERTANFENTYEGTFRRHGIFDPTEHPHIYRKKLQQAPSAYPENPLTQAMATVLHM